MVRAMERPGCDGAGVGEPWRRCRYLVRSFSALGKRRGDRSAVSRAPFVTPLCRSGANRRAVPRHTRLSAVITPGHLSSRGARSRASITPVRASGAAPDAGEWSRRGSTRRRRSPRASSSKPHHTRGMQRALDREHRRCFIIANKELNRRRESLSISPGSRCPPAPRSRSACRAESPRRVGAHRRDRCRR
jgi:hypothetical protein